MNPTSEPSGALVLALPAELIRKATDIASVCKEIVTQTAVTIQDRQYVKVEGWMSIATAHGCTASARDVEEVEGGVRAIGEIRRIDNGQVIATAEGFVGKDEAAWYGGVTQTRNGPKTHEKRPDYAIRAMAQTRAISRACRTAFAHVVVMMNVGLSTTPAEEVPLGGFNDGPAQDSNTPPKNVTPTEQKTVEVPRDSAGHYTLPAGMKWRDVPVHFGKNKGIKLGQLEDKSIGWYLEKWEPKPYGQMTDISPADKLLLAGVNAWTEEQNARGGRSA